jgi:two-component system OmpR family response regulator
VSFFNSMAFPARRILVADEDPAVVGFIIQTLRQDGYSVFHAYDGLAAIELALSLTRCDLIISDTRIDGMPGIELIRHLRQQLPTLPVVYIANAGRSTPELEAQLPAGVPILSEPFSADELRRTVGSLLTGRVGVSTDV